MKSVPFSILAAVAVLDGVRCAAVPDDSPEIEVPQQTATPEPARSSNDNTCNFFQKQIRDPQDPDKLIWVAASPDVSLNQCTEVCGDAVAKNVQAGEIASTSCIHYSGEMDWQPYYGSDSDIDNGMRVGPGNCSCNMPLINDIAEGFVEALPAVAELGCNIIMSALNAVIDIGAVAIPGVGQAISGGMIAGIQAAKLAAYTYDAASVGASAFSSWASGGMCGNSHLPEDIRKAFDIMNSVTPAVLPKGSFFNGATPKWAKGSGKAGDKGAPDAKTADKAEPTADQTRDSDEDSPRTTQGARKCSQHDKRGPKGKKCEDDAVHITSVLRSKVGTTTTITETCSIQDFPDACAHYYSAIHERGARDIFTCDDEEKRVDAAATRSWGQQHHRAWREFAKHQYFFEGEVRDTRCQADEWPPGYFLPQSREEQKKPEWGQLIR